MHVIVGQIAGAHGMRGHVKVIVRTDDPALRFQAGVVLDTDRKELPRLTVRQVRHAGGSWQLAFDEVPDRTAAEALRGTLLSIETTHWEDEDNAWYDSDLVGLAVHHVNGTYLGQVHDIEHGPAQDLLVVRTADGSDVRVPFVSQLVPEVTATGIRVAPPGGLFEEE